MAKCLRCGADAGWIEGRVRDEPSIINELHDHIDRLSDECIAMRSAIDDARDAILNDRGPLAEAGMTSDQTNAVLAILDAIRLPDSAPVPRTEAK